jgi:hypothetical protein
VATRTEEVQEARGWDPVPPGHPDRAAFEEKMRELGIRPATRWESRADSRVFSKPGWRKWLMDAARRVWYGPPLEPLTDEEMRMIMRPREETYSQPERVPPDDPERLAWEAELRAKGYSPAKVWNWPERERIAKATLWERIKYRVSRGW